jgi:sigma-B regulation protein RsbU (phosphoserine phosphatase)
MDPLLDNAPCLYFSYGDNGLLRDVNATLCSQLGYTKHELIGQKVEMLFTLPTRIFSQTHFMPLLQMQGSADEIFMTLQTADKRYVPLLINAKRDAVDGIATCVGITVYNRKKFEDELVAARNAAEKALLENTELQKAKEELQAHAEQLDGQVFLLDQQHSELQQFNRAITHDLQEPLRKMLVFSNMLQEGEKDNLPATVQALLDKLYRVVQQMRTAVSGLQQYVWLNDAPQRYTPVNLNTLLLLVKAEVEKDEGTETLVMQTDSLPVIKGDHEQFRLLFFHLLQNALKFRKEGSVPSVEIRGTVLQQNRFRNLKDKYKYEDFLRITVKDDGVGFDPVYREQVFALFKRLHSGVGRGLGLSLAKKIVENHGGTISAASEPQRGTTITLFLPVEAGVAMPAEAVKTPMPYS